MKYILILALLLGLFANATAQTLSVQEFNLAVSEAHSRGETWTHSPLQVTLKFVGDRHESSKRVLEISSTPEQFSNAEITMTEEGLMDDSVSGHRYELSLLRVEEGFWQIEQARKTWKCQPGRGHQDYSTEPCL